MHRGEGGIRIVFPSRLAAYRSSAFWSLGCSAFWSRGRSRGMSVGMRPMVCPFTPGFAGRKIWDSNRPMDRAGPGNGRSIRIPGAGTEGILRRVGSASPRLRRRWRRRRFQRASARASGPPRTARKACCLRLAIGAEKSRVAPSRRGSPCSPWSTSPPARGRCRKAASLRRDAAGRALRASRGGRALRPATLLAVRVSPFTVP